MARRTASAGRTLVVFFIGLAVAFGLVALGGQWTPTLGLDLQGGTRITLIAKNSPSQANLNEAASIIDQRVNGSGVSEATVTTQGNSIIQVEIPGNPRSDLVNTVKRQAQLRFRLVCAAANCAPTSGAAQTSPTPSTPASTAPAPGTGVTVAPKPSTSTKPSSSSKPKASTSATPKPRTAPGWAKGAASATSSASATPATSSSASPTASPSSTPTSGSSSSNTVTEALAWMDNPDAASVAAFDKYTCPAPGAAPPVDDPNKTLVTCDASGQKYLLSKAIIEGTQLTGATAQIPQNSVAWSVSLNLNGSGSSVLSKVSTQLSGQTDHQFAIVLDGKVLEAAYFQSAITGGSAEINGNFTQSSAQSLATSLKYGSLPIAFQEPTTETIGPSLAGDQLHAGLMAGLFGLLLVMLYCLLYYRGLGVVVIASLLVAAAATYAMVLLLAKTAGFALTLPGIAGLIVAVGITADSFIVYFERIRDEMRDGKSMRVAVEAGWARARNTCLAADTVSLLAAVVLYIFAAGVVKGFAFALGLSTLIDLVVFFWFTHPMVSWLARYKFFNTGHKLSGLDAENLGVTQTSAHSFGGRA